MIVKKSSFFTLFRIELLVFLLAHLLSLFILNYEGYNHLHPYKVVFIYLIINTIMMGRIISKITYDSSIYRQSSSKLHFRLLFLSIPVSTISVIFVALANLMIESFDNIFLYSHLAFSIYLLIFLTMEILIYIFSNNLVLSIVIVVLIASVDLILPTISPIGVSFIRDVYNTSEFINIIPLIIILFFVLLMNLPANFWFRERDYLNEDET